MPIYDDKRPTIAPEGLCPHCKIRQVMIGDTPDQADVEVTTRRALRTIARQHRGDPQKGLPGMRPQLQSKFAAIEQELEA